MPAHKIFIEIVIRAIAQCRYERYVSDVVDDIINKITEIKQETSKMKHREREAEKK